MARLHLTLSLNTCELQPLLAEFRVRVDFLGLAEAERRIGCEMDEAFFCSLIEIKLLSRKLQQSFEARLSYERRPIANPHFVG